MQFEIKNRFTGDVLFTADLSAQYEGQSRSVQLGAAVRLAVKASANLWGADLRSADLRGADLRGADLGGANLRGADLRGAKNAKLAQARTEIVPREGEVIGWKRAGKHIVKLRVPPDAARSNATGRKCRAEYVEVLEIEGADEAKGERGGVYRVGVTARADSWDDNRWNECSHGIHFFLTREEAESW